MRAEVAGQVRAEAARRGYKQGRLALLLGESQSTVSRMLNGHKPFDIDHLTALAAEWDLPITDLIPTAGARQTSPVGVGVVDVLAHAA